MADDRPRGSSADARKEQISAYLDGLVADSQSRARWYLLGGVLLGAAAIGAWYLPAQGFWLWGLLHWQSTGIGCLSLILLSQAQYRRGQAAGLAFGAVVGSAEARAQARAEVNAADRVVTGEFEAPDSPAGHPAGSGSTGRTATNG